MSKHFAPPRARGILSVRADASSAAEVLNQLKKTFEDFKAENEAELKALKKDVVQSEKVDRINAEVGRLTTALDDINRTLAALRVGGTDAAASAPEVAAHRTAFAQYFRKGADAGLRDLEVKAKLVTGSDPDGGYVVPDQMESTIDRVLGTVSALRSLSRVINVSTASYKKLVNMGGASSGWVGEEQARPETNTPTLRELLFTVMEIYAKPAATQSVLDDSAIDLEQWLADEVSITFAEQESAAFVSGTGVNRPRGLLTYPTVVNASYAWGSLGFINTGAAAAFATTAPADALVDLYHALKQGYRSGASWIMNDNTLSIIRKMKDGQGNYLWAPPSAAEGPSTILGKPVSTDDNMPSVAANAFPVAFGDFRRGYLIVDRVGIRVLRDPYSSKPNVEFYTTKRVGGGVQNFEAIKLLRVAAS
jgi:HK97 family phage major capsid protein